MVRSLGAVSKNDKLVISNEIIHPGEEASLALPLPELFSCAPMYMPIKVVHGKEAGPTLLVTAAMHGNELNGAEIINRLLKSSQLKKLKGTLIAVPIMNVYGFVNKTRTMPGGAQLNTQFPGSPNGTHAARLAHLFCSEIFSLADYCIDLQTGWLNCSNLPQIFATEDDAEELKLAHAFAAPVISEIEPPKGSLRAYADKKNIPYLVYEAGEAMRFDESSIRIGLKGVANVMRFLSMLPPAKTQAKKQKSFLMKDTRWVRSPTSGISHSSIKLGQQVKKGEQLAVIKDPFGAGSDISVKAPFGGVVVSMNNLPLVYEGVPLFQLAAFEKLSLAATHIEDWIDASEIAGE
jgi:predicted deacylase